MTLEPFIRQQTARADMLRDINRCLIAAASKTPEGVTPENLPVVLVEIAHILLRHSGHREDAVIDYRDLLRRYMQVVLETESITYVDEIWPDEGFTAEEIAELQRLERELMIPWRQKMGLPPD